jgi:hypothetical protein
MLDALDESVEPAGAASTSPAPTDMPIAIA